jgi:hypothetical protein
VATVIGLRLTADLSTLGLTCFPFKSINPSENPFETIFSMACSRCVSVEA